MNQRIIRFLGNYPFLKITLKRLYQYCAFVIYKHRREELFINHATVFSEKNKESFFGYYDKSPLNKKSQFVLFHSTDIDTSKKPKKTSLLDIIVYDLVNNKIRYKCTTKAWNWQQGSRLQWINEENFIYNDFDEGKKKFISIVKNSITGEEVSRFERPVQDSFEDRFFLSLDYTRLNTLRPDYGYRNLPNLNEEELQILEDDGIWFIDFSSGKEQLILGLKEIVNFNYNPKFEGGRHYVNHIMIAPNGEKFVFLHRYFKKDVRYDRLILSDLNGKMMLLADNDMVSHYNWYGNNRVFGYMRGKDGIDGYYLLSLEDQSIKLFEDKELQKLGDGHPTIFNNIYVTDNYPDKSRTQTLVYGNLPTKKSTVIAKLHNGLKFNGESRCDLHPRLSSDGSIVFFDSVHTGRRQLYMMDINNLKL